MDIQELYVTAELAHIDLKENELEGLRIAVEQMVANFEKMGELDIAGLEPTTHPFVKGNRTRPDVSSRSGVEDDMLEQSPDLEDRFICIPNVL